MAEHVAAAGELTAVAHTLPQQVAARPRSSGLRAPPSVGPERQKW
ncbi:MAG: hypothetical protein JWR37_5173 [Mycobacterium sp.]|nr:hypothetical protein [Mycobacterium sp.]